MSVEQYVRLFEELSPEVIDQCDRYVSPDIRFKDPFNDVKGISLFKKLLHKTLEDVKDPSFDVTHVSEAGDVTFLRWVFKGYVNGLGDWTITGMSEIRLDSEGRIREHIDHWDASEQFYMKLPVLKQVLGWIRKRLQVS
ncbi:nuclear transport factor 2 family protein [Terasakiella pusilla]|uniref:nuclear transport factor 2 family protein n=1 Tax=Terasakiella pusilla TaxID=64973 RepID=UPI003AA82310